jgi:hypothetical protein
MGFVPSSSTIQLYAYFTEYAREKIFNGVVDDFKVTQFSLHDEDINYLISKETIGVDSSGNTLYNTLKSGFLPDITGDIDSCVKSNKSSIVFGKNTLTGTTQVSTPVVFGCTDLAASNYNPLATVDDGSCIITPPSGGRALTIGFQNSTNTPIENYSSPPQKKNFSYNFFVDLKQNIGESNPTLAEILNTSFIIDLAETPISDVLSNSTIKVNGNSLPTTVNLAAGSTFQFTLSFSRDVTFNPNPSEVNPVVIKLKLISTNINRPIDPTKQIFTYRANVYTA